MGMDHIGDSLSHNDESQNSLLQMDTSRAKGNRQLTFWVRNPNPYSGDKDSISTVSIRILEVLFDDQPCSLVYMQDLT